MTPPLENTLTAKGEFAILCLPLKKGLPLVYFMNLDLFEDPAPTLAKQYLQAFEGWLCARENNGSMQQDSSKETYAHMWSAFAAWCVDKRLGLQDLRAHNLSAYLASRATEEQLSDRYAWRLLHLINWVLGQHARQQHRPCNPAATDLLDQRPDIRFAQAARNDPPPEYLPTHEAKRLITYLTEVRPGRGAPDPEWQEVRNRTAIALMLGAGLTPGDVRALLLTNIVLDAGHPKGVPRKLRLPGNGNSPGRETPIAGWAGQLLKHWLDVRANLNIPGSMALPSTRTGKPWSKNSHYKTSKEVLRAAGVTEVEGGTYRLRHTFVLRQLRRRASPVDVAKWIGVSDPAVMERYLRVLETPKDVI
jgi:integrase